MTNSLQSTYTCYLSLITLSGLSTTRGFLVGIVKLVLFTSPALLAKCNFNFNVKSRICGGTYTFLVTICSTKASTQYFALNSRMNRGSLRMVRLLVRVCAMYSTIPEFACDTQVLATTHKCITLRCLGCSCNTLLVKVFLFSSSDSH